MRLIAGLLFALLGPAEAAENWFLPYEPDDTTILLLHFDTAADQEPNAAEAPITATLTQGVERLPGRFGNGVKLSGAPKQCVRVKDDSGLLRLGHSDEFTIELWCRPAGGANAGLLSVGTRFYLKVTPGRGTATVGYRAASFPIRWFPLTNVPIRIREWNHVALTHDADRVFRVYVNGALAATAAHEDEGDYAEGGHATFGAHDGWSSFFAGEIDEVRVSRGVKQFAPLLSQRSYVEGESVQMSLDLLRLPPRLSKAEVTILAGKDQRVKRTLAREQLNGEIVSVAELGDGDFRLVATFLDAEGGRLSEIEAPLSCYVARLQQIQQRRAAVATKLARHEAEDTAAARCTVGRQQLAAIDAFLEARQFAEADRRLAAAERVTNGLESGESSYRAQLRSTVRNGKPKNDVRLTMSWPGDTEQAAAAFPWAERLGANELVSSHGSLSPEGIRAWKDAGYRTVVLTGQVLHNADRLKEHPEEAEFGYWVTDSVEARTETVTVKVTSPTWGNESISYRHDPKAHWRVLDATANTYVPAKQWDVDQETGTVTVERALPDHRYRVYFMIETHHIGDPLKQSFADATVADLEEFLQPYKGVLDTLWYDDLGYAYPGPTPQGAWDWESYTLAGRPERTAQFERETGIAFDPGWLVMPPRTIEVAPRRGYLRWQDWIQQQINPWMKRVTDVTRKYVDSTWLYWGDCHVGIEPYLGALTQGKVDEIDKPAADAVTARALVDFPGDTYRRLRVNWLHTHLAASDRTAGTFMTQWGRCKRGLLMKPARGLYWMPFPNVAKCPDPSIREDLTETLAEINDEFRLLAEQLAGAEAFKHDLDVYVVHSWGRQYSWRPWGSPVLTHLTDLPVRVHFVSFEEVEQSGIPADADVLFCYGLPNSAWSGGHWWASGTLRQAFEAFVRGGGGLVALQAPSYCETPEPHWELATVLGVRGEGTSDFAPAKLDSSMLADTALEMSQDEAKQSLLVQTEVGRHHWLASGLPLRLSGLTTTVDASAVGDNSELLYAQRSSEGALSAGVVARQFGSGRVVYVSGNSAKHPFSRLLRRALFWAAKREGDMAKLAAEGDQPVFAYAYPTRKRLALMNSGDAATECTLRLDPVILGLASDAAFVLRDVVSGETVHSGRVPAGGLSLTLVPNCVRLLEVAPLGEQ